MKESSQDIESIDHLIAKRYEIISKIGKGAYGIVWKAIDRSNHQTIALKKVFGAFNNSLDAQRVYREISYLKKLAVCPLVVNLINVHRSENDLDLYLVFECMETDLFAVIRANILLDVHHRYIFWQLMASLKYVHSAGLIHRDLKPSNILINSDATSKLCDFGLSRTIGDNDYLNDMTDYIATRWYRAPEILFGSSTYSFPIDLWAAGCILAELVSGRPLFPGNSTMDQIERIISYTGLPTPDDYESFGSSLAETMLANVTLSKTRLTLEERLPDAPKEAIDLIKKLIVLNPKERPSAEDCLSHPYLAQFHNQKNEPVAKEFITLSLPDANTYTVRDYRNQVYRESVTAPELPMVRKGRPVRTSIKGL